MKWLSLLLALLATNAGAVTALVSPKYTEQITSLKSTYGVQQMKDMGAAKLIVYKPVAKKLAIPGAKGIVPFAAPQPKLYSLAWDWVDTYSSQPGYPTGYVTNIQFEIYSATELTNFPPMGSYNPIPNNFHLFGTTWWPNMSFTISPDQAHLFFINRAVDTWTNLPSKWNQ